MIVAHLAGILAPLAIYAMAVPMPGPSFVLISRASLCHGPAYGSAAGFGTTVGVAVYAVATVFGLTTLMLALPWLTDTIQIVGGVYLLYVGLSLLASAVSRRGPAENLLDEGVGQREGWVRSFQRGLLIGLGNPKMAAFFLGLFSPAVSQTIPFNAQMLVLGGIILIDLVYHQVLAQIAAKGRGLTRSAGRRFDALAGGCMAAFGFGLIAKGLASRT